MSDHVQALITEFEQLATHLQQLHHALNNARVKYWLLAPAPTAFSDAVRICTNIWYHSATDGRFTENCYGLVGIPPEIIPLINKVNLAKDSFRACVKALPKELGKPAELLHQRSEQLALALERSGLARLHLKQCYRQIPMINTTPAKVGLNWYTSGRSIRRLSLKDAETRLLKMDQGQPHIQLQLASLGKLQPGESLAQLQTQVPVMRANIQWQQNGEIMRKARNCPLPLFFPLQDNAPFPEHNKPPVEPPEARQRQQRSDLRIDPEVFLPSLRAHRYLK